MPPCPNCHAENSSEARFCAECGTRLSRTDAALQGQPATPAQPDSKRTIVLRGADIAPTERLPSIPNSAGEATIIAAPSAPANASSTPTAAIPAPPPGVPGGQTSAPPTLPPTLPAIEPAGRTGGGRLWLVIALVVLLGLGVVAALIVGLALIASRDGGTETRAPTAAVGGGLARLPTPAPRPTAPARPTAVPSPIAADGFSKVLLKDTFDDPNRSSFTEEKNDNASYTFVDGAYAIQVKTPKYLVWSSLDGAYGDTAVEVDTTLESGPSDSAAGVMFHYQDEDNFYLFSIAGDGSYSLELYTNNKQQTLIDWTDSSAIKGQGATNRLRVETEGQRIRLFVNGALLDEISDETLSKGDIAVAVHTFAKGDAVFRFDNLIVYGRK